MHDKNVDNARRIYVPFNETGSFSTARKECIIYLRVSIYCISM